MLKLSIALGAAALAFMPLAQAEDYGSGPVKMMKTDKGEVMTDSKGMTLYTFDKDSKGHSNCTGKCAVNWPPMMASSEAQRRPASFTRHQARRRHRCSGPMTASRSIAGRTTRSPGT